MKEFVGSINTLISSLRKFNREKQKHCLLFFLFQPEEDKDLIVVKDKEKARLSLLEEKISDALSLLLQLRNQVPVLTTLSGLTAPPRAQSKNSTSDSSQMFFQIVMRIVLGVESNFHVFVERVPWNSGKDCDGHSGRVQQEQRRYERLQVFVFDAGC